MGITPDANALWQQWLSTQKAWQSAVATQSSPDMKEVFQNVGDMSAVYMELAQKVLPHAQTPPTPETLQHWLKALEETVGVWSKRMATGFVTTQSIGATLQEQLTHWSKLQTSMQHYQTVSTQYHQTFTELQQAAFKDLTEHLSTLNAQGNSIESLRALVDAWGAKFEAHYQAWVTSNEYQTLYGELTNASVGLKSAFQEQFEPMLKMVNVPTRAELNAVYERLQDMRRENQALRASLETLAEQVQATQTKPKARKG